MDWQTTLSLLIVALAVVVVIRQAFGVFGSEGGAGCASGCDRCPARETSERGPRITPLVRLDAESPQPGAAPDPRSVT